jgi:hypothetical protein
LVKFITNRTVSELLEIRFGFDPEDVLRVTPNHKLHTDRGWVAADRITVDDRLTTEDGFVQVLDIRAMQEGPYLVFNLGDAFGNYFVSDYKLKVEASSLIDIVPKEFTKKCNTGKAFNRRAVNWNPKSLREAIVKRSLNAKKIKAVIDDNTQVEYLTETGFKKGKLGAKNPSGKHSLYDVGHIQPASLLGKIMMESERSFSKAEINEVITSLENLRLELYTFNRKMGATGGIVSDAKKVIRDVLKLGTKKF